MRLINQFGERIRASLLDETERRYFLFVCIYAMLSVIAAVMTVANILTKKGPLTIATLVYSLFCALIFALLLKKRISLYFSQAAFIVSFFLLLTFFIVSGMPDGFSILWVCFLPACGLLAFGRKTGTILCAVMLLELMFLLHTRLGLSLVHYDYGVTFKMRFPLIYIAFWGVSFVLETIRELTQRKLLETQERYRYLYSHDALTEVYNRYGFNELMDRYFQEKRSPLGLIILDIDRFKSINDLYGHMQGDVVLQYAARLIARGAGPDASVCRWGGEEFAVLIPGCADLRSVAERLAVQLRTSEIPLENGCVQITASIGAVLASDTGVCTAAQLVTLADQCLYRAKVNGRDCVECAER